VTGASTGIGEATSETLAAEGAAVVASARREERLTDLKGRVEGNGGRLEVVQADVTDEGQAHDLVQRTEDEFGGVDILVNNAGVMLLSKVEKGLSVQRIPCYGLPFPNLSSCCGILMGLPVARSMQAWRVWPVTRTSPSRSTL
jgi:NAD(P)-dependent dehydrogenase (short-subunit alcohol dehydrogenase family)